MPRRHVKRDDIVMVTTGKYKGQQGRIVEVLVKKNRVRVEGVALVKRHLPRRKEDEAGPQGIIDKLGSVAISNVALLDPKTGKPTKTARRILPDGSKVRVARQSGEQIGSAL